MTLIYTGARAEGLLQNPAQGITKETVTESNGGTREGVRAVDVYGEEREEKCELGAHVVGARWTVNAAQIKAPKSRSVGGAAQGQCEEYEGEAARSREQKMPTTRRAAVQEESEGAHAPGRTCNVQWSRSGMPGRPGVGVGVGGQWETASGPAVIENGELVGDNKAGESDRAWTASYLRLRVFSWYPQRLPIASSGPFLNAPSLLLPPYFLLQVPGTASSNADADTPLERRIRPIPPVYSPNPPTP
ncbi:hypothetical protein B0H13DRAFT_1866089 [Mycena leptocephala]|nr:hypothetical protein B0H13DRAFT_1866089 [Mycena leptocephala]